MSSHAIELLPLVDLRPAPIEVYGYDSSASTSPSPPAQVDPAREDELIQQLTNGINEELMPLDSENASAQTGLDYEPPHRTNENITKITDGPSSDPVSTRFLDLCKLHSIKFELDQGDTLVFIDYPESSADHIKQADCYGMAYSSQTLRVHSERLLDTGSFKFAELLNSTYQFRIQRRRKLVNKLPEGVKYVLDLTPPSEGDELVFQMTQLSLTPGIMKWWASQQLHSVSCYLVSGHDDICKCQRPVRRFSTFTKEEPSVDEPSSPQKDGGDGVLPLMHMPPTSDDLLRRKAVGVNYVCKTPDYYDIPDYCPIRHRNNIVRLLMILERKEVALDSAHRVWTLVGLAKIFDCPSIIRDLVAQWIMYGNNTRFIEVLPEEAMQIGVALELVQVTQCAFRILVNELALKETNTNPRNDLARTTVFGRMEGSLDDELSNIVQHAARALIERTSAIKDELRSLDVLDRWAISEWANLRQMDKILAQEEDEATVMARKSLNVLMKAIRSIVTNALGSISPNGSVTTNASLSSMDEDRATYVQPSHYENLNFILPTLNLDQRLLCPFIYQELAELMDKPNLFTSRIADVPDENGGSYLMPFPSLLFNFEKAMQMAVMANPDMAKSEDWSIFFNHNAQHDLEDAIDWPTKWLKSPLVDLRLLDLEIKFATKPYTNSWVRHDIEPALNITRHMLLTLTNNETKFLPLWAGGCNDGTGGVFETFLPAASMGPSGPGPCYHTGYTVPSDSSVAGSLLDEITMMKIKGSTVAGSVDAQDSISTVYAPEHVIADSVSILSESFDADDSEYREAAFEVPAEHQHLSQGLEMTISSFSDVDSICTITDHDFPGDDISMEVDNEEAENPGEDGGERSDSEDSLVMV